MRKVLIIDDDQAILNFLRLFLLQTRQFEIQVLQDSSKAYDLLKNNRFDLLLLDMDMPRVSGMDILKYIHEQQTDIVTIVLTGVEDVDMAINAMKLGTTDYMLKPIDEATLLATIQSALNKRDPGDQLRKAEPGLGRDNLKHKEIFQNIISNDIQMFKIFHFIEKFACTDNSVLIWGESGTGKELIAAAIHQISSRRDKKFVAVNAGAFADELFTSEFFGHDKGSFTGAVKDKKGFIEEADGGTLFLDEIGELALPIQVKLLRVLQEEEFYRLGSTQNRKVDVRIIAATNKNLFDEIKNGNFRKDLFFRLNINSINLPPLRERNGDVPLLAGHFLKVFSEKFGKAISGIGPVVMNLLKRYSFPGNVREMMNIINSSIIVESSPELQKNSLPHYFLENIDSQPQIVHGSQLLSLKDMEKNHIRNVLTHAENNRTKAAKILGISRVNLIAKIKKYNLE